MATDRTHAFANGPLYPVVPAAGRSLADRVRSRLCRWFVEALEKENARRAVEQFRRCAVVGEAVRITPTAWLHSLGPRERVQIGDHVICRGLIRMEEFAPGQLEIGDHSHIGDDCVISCAERVRIGRRCLLAHGVQIFDNNSHPVDAGERAHDYRVLLGQVPPPRPPIATGPVILEDGVWLGLGTIVLKGVTIGENTVVAAGSVVTHDLPPRVIAAGNPARPVRELATP